MSQTRNVAQTVETASPQSRVTDNVQENTSSIEHAQFQARMRGINIQANGSWASISQVVQRIAAGDQHPLQKHEDFMYLQRSIGNQAVIQLLDRMKAAKTEGIHKTAAAGVQGDVTTGTKAATASKAIGAEAYTTGNTIAITSTPPDLHTTNITQRREKEGKPQLKSSIEMNKGEVLQKAADDKKAAKDLRNVAKYNPDLLAHYGSDDVAKAAASVGGVRGHASGGGGDRQNAATTRDLAAVSAVLKKSTAKKGKGRTVKDQEALTDFEKAIIQAETTYAEDEEGFYSYLERKEGAGVTFTDSEQDSLHEARRAAEEKL